MESTSLTKIFVIGFLNLFAFLHIYKPFLHCRRMIIYISDYITSLLKVQQVHTTFSKKFKPFTVVWKVCVIRTPPISLISSCLTLSPSAQSRRLLFCSPNMQFSIQRCFVKGFPKSLAWLTSFHHLCLRTRSPLLGRLSWLFRLMEDSFHHLFSVTLFCFILFSALKFFCLWDNFKETIVYTP